MEPEPQQHVPQEPPPKRGRGNPNLGKTTKIPRGGYLNWEKSCLYYVIPFAEKAGWKRHECGKKVVGIIQLLGFKNEKVAKVLKEWEAIPQVKRGGSFVLDKCCDAAGVNRLEFADLALKAVRAFFRRQAQARVEVELADIVDASIAFAKRDNMKESSQERQRHLETQGIIDKAGPRTSISLNQKQIAQGVPAKSFDSAMDELDDAIDGEILGETRLIGDGR